MYLCARSEEKANKAIDGIKTLYPNAHITSLIMDHTSLQTVVSAAKEFLTKEETLHGLINNAGVMNTPFEMTADGYEEQWQTNYLAHWVFTSHLLPVLRKTAKGSAPGSVRIVNVSSVGHWWSPKEGIVFSNTSIPNASSLTRYGQSKLAKVLHSRILQKNYGPGSPSAEAGEGEIWIATVHPGLVDTNLATRSEFPPIMKKFFGVAAITGASFDSDKGAWTSVFCAASPAMTRTQSGAYFQRIAVEGWRSCWAKNEELAEKLEEWTRTEMVKGGWIGDSCRNESA